MNEHGNVAGAQFPTTDTEHNFHDRHGIFLRSAETVGPTARSKLPERATAESLYSERWTP